MAHEKLLIDKSETTIGLFSTDYDKPNLQPLIFYKRLVVDLEIDEYIYELYTVSSQANGLHLCKGLIMCNQKCFFTNTQLLRYFLLFRKYKRLIRHLYDDLRLEEYEFCYTETLKNTTVIEEELTLSRYYGQIINGSLAPPNQRVITEDNIEEQFEAFIDEEYGHDERIINFRREKILSSVLNEP